MRTKGDLIFENAYKVIWPLFLGSNVSVLPTLLSDAGVEPLQMAIFFCQLVPCQALSSGMPQGAWKLEGMQGEGDVLFCLLPVPISVAPATFCTLAAAAGSSSAGGSSLLSFQLVEPTALSPPDTQHGPLAPPPQSSESQPPRSLASRLQAPRSEHRFHLSSSSSLQRRVPALQGFLQASKCQ